MSTCDNVIAYERSLPNQDVYSLDSEAAHKVLEKSDILNLEYMLKIF